MIVPQHNISVFRGTTFRKTITWTQSNNQPVDLTGCSAVMQIRDSSQALILQLTVGSGITLGGTNGTIELFISAATTSTMESGKYEINVTLANTDVVKFLKGTFTIIDGVIP